MWMHTLGVGVEQKVANDKKEEGGMMRIKDGEKVLLFVQSLFIISLL